MKKSSKRPPTDLRKFSNALEHPQGDTVRNLGWSRIPLLWMLSNRSLKAWERFSQWFAEIAKRWQHELAARP